MGFDHINRGWALSGLTESIITWWLCSNMVELVLMDLITSHCALDIIYNKVQNIQHEALNSGLIITIKDQEA